MTMKYHVEGAKGSTFGECVAMGYTLAELKRLVRQSYPDKNARIWIEKGCGIATIVVEEWRKYWWQKTFRRVR